MDYHVEKIEKAYPSYFDTYSEVDKLIEYVNDFNNLYCVGRNGQHRYNNMDHSMETAIVCVDNILNNIKDKETLSKLTNHFFASTSLLMNKRTIELSGHIIDSLTLTKTMGIIMDKGGEFDILEIDVGRKKSDVSHAKIEVSADSPELLESILDELSEEQRSATMMYYFDEMSVKQIAEIQGVSEGTVSRWERGIKDPTISQAKRIGEICGVHYNDIIFLPKVMV